MELQQQNMHGDGVWSSSLSTYYTKYTYFALLFFFFSLLHVHDALNLATFRKMLSSIFYEILAVLFPHDSLIHRTALQWHLALDNRKVSKKEKDSSPTYLAAVGTLVVYTLVASLLLHSVAVILPKVSINVWIFPCFDNFGDGLHLSSASRRFLLLLLLTCTIIHAFGLYTGRLLRCLTFRQSHHGGCIVAIRAADY